MLTMFAFRLSIASVVMLWLVQLGGCESQQAPLRPSGSAASQADRADSIDRPRPVSPAVSAEHPIDQTPEGIQYRAAVAAVDRGDLETALQYRKQLETSPQYSVLADAIGGFMLAKVGKFEEAIAVAEAISRVPVMQSEAYLIAGQAFHGLGRWGAAIEAFRGALQAYEHSTRAHRWLGALLYDTGAMWEAVEHLRAVAALDPSDTRSLRLSGLIHYDYQQYAEAIQDYQELLLRPLDDDLQLAVRLELADSLRELRRYDEALKTLADSAQQPSVIAMRAFCHESAGDEAQALQTALRAIEREPGNRLANLVAGRIELSQRRPVEAVAYLDRAVAADSTAHESRFLLGRALLQGGNTEQGQVELDRATQLRELTLELAELHLEAIARPEDAPLRVKMGELAEQIGRHQAARSWYRAAIGLDPENLKAKASLRRLDKSTADPVKTSLSEKAG